MYGVKWWVLGTVEAWSQASGKSSKYQSLVGERTSARLQQPWAVASCQLPVAHSQPVPFFFLLLASPPLFRPPYFTHPVQYAVMKYTVRSTEYVHAVDTLDRCELTALLRD